MYTHLRLMYRDSSNYKEYTTIAFEGEITPEQEAAFKAHLMDNDTLYPDQVGLEGARFGGSYEDDDFSVNEFDEFAVYAGADGAESLDTRSIDEFIAEFVAHEWTDPHADDPVGEFTTITTAEGYKYTPWTDGWAVGFKVTHPETKAVEYIYLNPSSDSDDGVATVFPYQGEDGYQVTDDVAGNEHFALFGGSPVADTEGTVKYPAIEVPVYSGRIDNLDERVEWYLNDRRVNPARVEEFKTHVATLPDDAAKLAYIETWVTVRNA